MTSCSQIQIFLDVGAHLGETLEVALDPRFGFDEIHCFEPSPSCWSALDDRAASDERVRIHRVALWSSQSHLQLFGSGEVGASLFETKQQWVRKKESITAVDTASYLGQIMGGCSARLTVKVNVEGAELEVLTGIQGFIRQERDIELAALLVHVDADKIPGQASRAASARALVHSLKGKVTDQASAYFGPNVQAKTRNWLRWERGGLLQRTQLMSLGRTWHAVRLVVWHGRRSLMHRLGR